MAISILNKLSTGTCILAAIMTGSAAAEHNDKTGTFRVGLELAGTIIDRKNSSEVSDIDSVGFGGGFKAGYSSTNNFGLEAGGRVYMSMESVIVVLFPDSDVSLTQSVIYLAPTYTWSKNKRFFRLKAGAARWRADYLENIDSTRNSYDRAHRAETGVAPYAGAEAGLQRKHLEFGVFFDYHATDSLDVKGLGMGVSYRF